MYMNSADKFIMFSDGSFTTMGIDVSEKTITANSSKLTVKDPVTVIFSTTNGRNSETGETESRLNFEMIPWVFGALLTEGENIWEVDAKHVLKNNAISPTLQAVYYNTLNMTNHVKKNADGQADITPNH